MKLIKFLFTLLALTAATACLAEREPGEPDDDPMVDAGPKPDADPCDDDGVCDPGETHECEAACPCDDEVNCSPDKSKWWGRDCGPECVEIDSAFTACSRRENTPLDCDDLTEAERIELRNLAPAEADIAGTCGLNIVGWGAPGEYNPQTLAGSKRLRVPKVNGWYRFTRTQAGASPGSPCHVNVVWPRPPGPAAYVDAWCDAADGKEPCWNQGLNNSLIGTGTHLAGPFAQSSPAGGEIYFDWGPAGEDAVPRGDNP